MALTVHNRQTYKNVFFAKYAYFMYVLSAGIEPIAIRFLITDALFDGG